MNWTRGKYAVALACGAIAAGFVVFSPGCASEECIDRFDCVGKGAEGDFLVCVDNKCVKGTPTPLPDAGPAEDAGEDAGMDAGEMDAGMMDAGMDAGETMDGGETDAGMMDGGETDAGMDAGMAMPVDYVANLTGAQEVPPVTTTANGTGTCTLNAAQDSLACTVSLSAGLVPSAAHIHNAHAGASGPVLYGFTAPTPVTFMQTFPVTASDVTLLQQGRLYINVHTATNGSGEIRGQLLLPGEKLYSSQLTGTAGSGSAGYIVNATGDAITWDVTLTSVTGVTSAGIQDKMGAPLVDLTGLNDDGGFGTAPVTANTVTTLDSDAGVTHVEAGSGALSGDVVKLQ